MHNVIQTSLEVKKNISIFLVILGCLTSTVSCQQSKNPIDFDFDLNNPTQSIYDPSNYFNQGGVGSYHEKYGILVRYTSEYDIKPEVSINNRIDFSFYNYGEELRINNNVRQDVFANNIATKMHFVIVKENDISNVVQKQSKLYGSWSEATVTGSNYSFKLNDVIVSPLATKFILSRSFNDREALVLVRFENSEGSFRNYLFLETT
jgi:hypothetical protein